MLEEKPPAQERVVSQPVDLEPNLGCSSCEGARGGKKFGSLPLFLSLRAMPEESFTVPLSRRRCQSEAQLCDLGRGSFEELPSETCELAEWEAEQECLRQLQAEAAAAKKTAPVVVALGKGRPRRKSFKINCR